MKELTIEEFNDIYPGSVFAKGTTIDDQEGVNMTTSGKDLKWVAKKGFANDWCIYIHFSNYSDEYVEQSGDKVTFEKHIRKLVPCNYEVFRKYRY
jgi:hypothetical protein